MENAPDFFQLIKEYHEIKDSAIAICPDYAPAYKRQSTAYLETGDFITWKKLIDKAVELDLENILYYRGWCRFQFFRDYQGAIDDIEELDRLVNHDIGYGENGYYHLNLTKGLCYKMLGQKEGAIQFINDQINQYTTSVGLYDYLHLGVLYLETSQYQKALEAVDRQSTVAEWAENIYYKVMTYKQLNDHDKCNDLLEQAKELYNQGRFMFDPFTHQVDKVYFGKIEEAIQMNKS